MEMKKVNIRIEAVKDYQKYVFEYEFEPYEGEVIVQETYDNLREFAINEAAKGINDLVNVVKPDNEVKPVQPKEEEIPEDKRPTEKQIEMLKKYDLNIPKTKAAASEIIRRKFEELKNNK